MGWVMMSERELNRVEVLAQVDDGRLSIEERRLHSDRPLGLKRIAARQPPVRRLQKPHLPHATASCRGC